MPISRDSIFKRPFDAGQREPAIDVSVLPYVFSIINVDEVITGDWSKNEDHCGGEDCRNKQLLKSGGNHLYYKSGTDVIGLVMSRIFVMVALAALRPTPSPSAA